MPPGAARKDRPPAASVCAAPGSEPGATRGASGTPEPCTSAETVRDHAAEPRDAAAASDRATARRASVAHLVTLANRSDFLACARGRKAPAPGFVLQARRRDPAPGTGSAIRVGFTASKKVGNAVARNRAKRRLRALARAVISAEGRPGWDYVLIARHGETASRRFDAMEAELARALARVHGATPSD